MMWPARKDRRRETDTPCIAPGIQSKETMVMKRKTMMMIRAASTDPGPGAVLHNERGFV